MFKVASIVRFPDDAGGADRADASKRWAETQSASVRALAGSGLVRCTHSTVLGPLPGAADLKKVYSPATETLFDGYSCYWFADRDAYDRAAGSPEWTTLLAEGSPSSDGAWSVEMTSAVYEAVIVDGPAEPYKVVWIVRFKPDLDEKQGHDYWENVHGPIVADAGISRYVQNHVTGPARPGFDGFSECWFRDERQFVDALATPHWGRLHEDRHHIFDMPRMWSAVLREDVLLG